MKVAIIERAAWVLDWRQSCRRRAANQHWRSLIWSALLRWRITDIAAAVALPLRPNLLTWSSWPCCRCGRRCHQAGRKSDRQGPRRYLQPDQSRP